MLKDLNPNDYNRRTYVVSSGDSFSTAKAEDFEATLAKRFSGQVSAPLRGSPEQVESYTILVVPRARRIHQSLLFTPVSALQCLLSCLTMLESGAQSFTTSGPSSRWKHPDLILTNGPGTGVIVVFASILLRYFDVGRCETNGKMRTIYVESWARVRRLSLSGKLLVRVVDRFLVQWKGLENVGGRGEFRGVLV